MVTKNQILLPLQGFLLLLEESWAVALFSDFSKPFLKRLYSLSHVVTGVSVSLSLQPVNDFPEISLNMWAQ